MAAINSIFVNKSELIPVEQTLTLHPHSQHPALVFTAEGGLIHYCLDGHCGGKGWGGGGDVVSFTSTTGQQK